MSFDEMTQFLANIATIVNLPVAIAAFIGGGGTILIGTRMKNIQKICSNLYPIISNHRTEMTRPVLPPPGNPFLQITPQKVLIVEGPNKVGKTSMFAQSIPWYRRFGPFSYSGFVLNGADATTAPNFNEWRNNQMRGALSFSGAEISHALENFKKQQKLRNVLSGLFPSVLIFKSKRPYIIVDQFEELVKRFPVEALAFANNLTNDQVRNGLSYVFFVVNSSNCTKALKNLNQGDRFDVMRISQTSFSLPNEGDEMKTRFEECQNNIGLFKDTLQVPLDKLRDEVSLRQRVWKDGDTSWNAVDEEEINEMLIDSVHSMLSHRAVKILGKRTEKLSAEEVNERIQILTIVLKSLSKSAILQAPYAEWISLFNSRTQVDISKDLAVSVMTVLSTPVSTTALVSNTVCSTI
jgi:hypothetical protein